jgi:hypothetical protein
VATTPTTEPEAGTITKADLEASFRGVSRDVEDVVDQQRNRALIVGAAVVVGIVAITFVLGRRRGQKNRTVVEVRRL